MTATGFDVEKFSDIVRRDLYAGKLAQTQFEGLRFIMREWKARHGFGGDHRHLAYMLATTHHETAFTMQPITEYGSQKYLKGKRYWPYIGRGYVQLTWDYNYKKAGDIIGENMVDDPELALQPDLAAKIMFEGMVAGWFTGKALSNYFDHDTDDPVNARRIINGTDKAQTIAGYHKKFLGAIKSSLVGAP